MKKTPNNKKLQDIQIDEEYKSRILEKGYLGKKGYTIPKNCLSKEDYDFLKKDLLLQPQMMGAKMGIQQQVSSFPVYRENTNKIYIPRFYGIERYGLPKKSELQQGDDVELEFVKTLRDYQEDIITVYLDHVNTPVAQNDTGYGNGGILEVPCGRGKCMGRDTPILMYDGTIKMVQDVKVGDVIMGDDSTPRNVLTLARGREQMYKVIPVKGDPYIVNESHILSLKYSSTVNKDTPKGTVRDISVLDYLNLPKSYHGKGGVLVGYRVPIRFPKREVDIDPYILGYWLGDGTSATSQITTEEIEVVNYFKSYAEKINCNLHQGTDSVTTRHSLHYTVSGKLLDNNERTPNVMLQQLRKYNLLQNKHIPHDYKCNDRQTQLELLAGIIDSDGSAYDNVYDIIQKNEILLDDIIFLARSLGFAAYKSECKKSCMYKGERKEGTYYRACIHGKGLDEIPVKCIRKKVTPRQQIKDALNTRIRLEKLEVDDYYGFEIDGNRRFVLGDFTVTHNTVMALKIIASLQKKTLIIVHKEFLMNQWIERIQEFVPNARVGKIQGSTFDIHGKDIVIGMLQSLYDKEYGIGAYDSFGLTIIDEVHRIGSEQFSRALCKTITPYMLGISATVDRKDGLTKVLYMFIGNKIYSEERKKEDKVNVRGIVYETNDPEFNEIEYDFRGTVKYSTMISKICGYGPRTHFIANTLKDLLEEDNEKQIMVLCHNRSFLTDLHQIIVDKELCSVGFYVGGMKQEALQETESKQIVLATYAMAAEALDIKTLSTLVMASPKTDITQSVGRILRMKHDNPIIVDIIDKHDPFQKQWQQRRRYYKKCNYLIKHISSSNYKNMLDYSDETSDWDVLFDPSKPGKSKGNGSKSSSSDNTKEEYKCLITGFFD